MNVSSQFHALPEEVLQFVLHEVTEFSLHAAVLRQFPSEVVSIGTDGIREAFADPAVVTLVLTVGPAVLPADGLNDLLAKNPQALLLDIGRRSAKGLGESWLTVRASDPRALTVWKKVVGRFKKMTHAGATAVNPDSGATCRVADHRYTDGAKALNQEGVAMLPMAGGAILRLG